MSSTGGSRAAAACIVYSDDIRNRAPSSGRRMRVARVGVGQESGVLIIRCVPLWPSLASSLAVAVPYLVRTGTRRKHRRPASLVARDFRRKIGRLRFVVLSVLTKARLRNEKWMQVTPSRSRHQIVTPKPRFLRLTKVSVRRTPGIVPTFVLRKTPRASED